MRKKPDTLLLLAVLVVSGVVLSQFVIFSQADNSKYSVSTAEFIKGQSNHGQTAFSPRFLKQRQLVRIDPLRQQTR